MTPSPQCDEAMSPSSSDEDVLAAVQLAAAEKMKVKAMPRATSMLEMSDIRDMMRFGEDMKAATRAPSAADDDVVPKVVVAAKETDDSFFIDPGSSDEDAPEADVAGGGFLQMSSVPPAEDDDGPSIDGTYHVPASQGGMRRVTSAGSDLSLSSASRGRISRVPSGGDIDGTYHIPASQGGMRRVTSGNSLGTDLDGSVRVRSNQGGMRRVVSMAALPSSRTQRLSLTSVAPAIHTIAEDEVISGAARSQTMEMGLDSSITSRRSFRRATSAGSGPLRRGSGQKGSANSLRALMLTKKSASSRSAGSNDHEDARIKSRTPETGLDESISFRSTHTSETGLDESINCRMIRSSSSASMRRSSSSASMRRMPSRSCLTKGSSNNLRSSVKSSNSRSSLKSSVSHCSVPSMDDTNHSLDSQDDEAAMDEPPTRTISNSMKRNVSFSSLEIRSYDVTLGDAPTSNGPPVALSWNHSATEEYDLDRYEDYRAETEPRRTKREMLMPAAHRHYLLMKEAGLSKSEIREAIAEARRCARGRERTAKNVRLGLQPVEEALERTRRKLSFRKRAQS